MGTQYGNYTVDGISHILQSQQARGYSTASVAAFILYECTCEIGDALKLFWHSRMNVVTVLFTLNWCAMLLWVAANLPITLLPANSHSRCELSNLLGPALDVLLLSVWTMFMTIRTFAISGYNWWMTTTVFVLCVIPVATSVYGYFAHRHFDVVNLPVVGETCLDISDTSASSTLALEIVTRISFLLPDIVVLLLTVVKTHAARHESKQHNIMAPFSALLLRNGIRHVVWMMALHIVNAVAFAFDRSWAPTFYMASTFLNPGMAIAISRFHLSLRRMAYELDVTVDPRLLSFGRIPGLEHVPTQSSGLIFASRMDESVEHADEHSDIDGFSEATEEWDAESENAELDSVLVDPMERERLYADTDGGGGDPRRTSHEDELVL